MRIAPRRLVPASVAASVVILLGSLYALGYSDLYTELLTKWGANPFQFAFVDAHAVLSAIECHSQGIDVYLENPCDVLGRVHVYSPLWLLASVLPITTAWTPIVGIAVGIAFLASLTMLPPGREWWQTWLVVIGTVSSTTAFAIERANIDLVVFVLAVLIGRTIQRGQRARMVGYGVVLLTGMLKFYPAALLIVAARERLNVFIKVSLGSAAVAACFATFYAHDLVRVLSLIPRAAYFDVVFGARDLPYGLAQIFGWPDWLAAGLLNTLFVSTVAFAVMLAGRCDLRRCIDALEKSEATFLTIGSTLLLGCFFTAQNVLYRSIYFLFVLPGLMALIHTREARRHTLGIVGSALVLLLMWEGAIRRATDESLAWLELPARYTSIINFDLWLLLEFMWWLIATILAALLIASLLHSQAMQDLSASFRQRRLS